MGITRNKVSEILKKYDISFDELADEKSLVDVRSVLNSVDEKYVLFSLDVTEPGGCGEGIEEFCCSILRDIVARSKGTISVKNIKSKIEIDEDGEEMVSISFKHDDKPYSWSFEADYPDEFYDGVMDWLKELVGEGYHDHREEVLWAWNIDAQALRDLKLLFPERSAKDTDEYDEDGEYDENEIIHLIRVQVAGASEKALDLVEIVQNDKCAELIQNAENDEPGWMIDDFYADVFHFTPLKAEEKGNDVSASYPISAPEHAEEMHTFLGKLFELLDIKLLKNWQMETITRAEYDDICDY